MHHRHEPLVAAAFTIAVALGITVYDAVYIALARSLDAVLVTADDRLVRAGADAGDWPVRLLGEE